MALVTLVDLGARLPSYLGRYLIEMHHVMAGRGLVALSTIGGVGRRMPILWDRPLRRSMALRTVLAEQFAVRILGGVAGRTIQDCFLRREARMAF